MTDDDARRWWLRPSARTVLILLLVVGGALLLRELLQGWFPHDEGALGQSAERVLRGQVPHRDFDEIYTGLLSYLNAATFAALGIGSVPMRIPLFLAALAWLWAMYRIVLRFAPPAGAGLVALIAFVWGVPNYPAAMPSWYILFAATFAALAMMRWHEDGDRRWLVLAGAMGGVAFLFKLSGIFIFAGGTLALVAEHAAGTPSAHDESRPSGRSAFEVAVPLLLVAVSLALASIVGGAGSGEFLRFALPIVVVAGAVAVRIWTSGRPVGLGRWGALTATLVPFAAGGLVPIALFFGFYAIVGGLPALLEGVFVTPFRRVAFAAMSPPPLTALLFVVPIAVFLWLPTTGNQRRLLPVIAALWFLTIIVLSRTDPYFYQAGWLSVWGLLFVVTTDVARRMLSRRTDAAEPARRTAVVTLACFAVALALIEYPFAAPIYTLYALPLAVLALAASVRIANRSSLPMQLVVAGFALAFGVLRVNPGTVESMGGRFHKSREIATLDIPRGGLHVRPAAAAEYTALIPFVQKQARGRTIWAGPDAPEVYFLSGLPNQTRTLFDFLDAPPMTPGSLVDRLDSLGVSVVVLKLRPDFSEPPTRETVDALRRVFPHQHQFQSFIVSWR